MDTTSDEVAMESVIEKSWFARFRQQYVALLRKNALVAWRSRRGTILRLLSPVIFLVIVLLLDFAIRADTNSSEQFATLKTPEPNEIKGIPPCSDDKYMKSECYDFIFSPLGDPAVERIVQNVMQRNDPPIPTKRVMGFADLDASNKWLLANPERASGGIHLNFLDPTNVAITLQGNHSVKIFRGTFQDPNYHNEIPLQVATQREISRYFAEEKGAPEAADMTVDVAWKLTAHPALTSTSIIGIALGTFLFAANMFSFVITMTVLVTERENKLTQAMQSMGMLQSAYWLSWATWEVYMGFLISLVTVAAGAAFQFDFFLDNSFGLTFLTLFMFQLAMTGLAFLLSSFLRKSTVAIILGYAIFLLGWIMQLVVVFGFPYKPSYYKKYNSIVTIIFSIIPWAPFVKAVNDLGEATAGQFKGLSFSERNSYCTKEPVSRSFSESSPSLEGETKYTDDDCVLPVGDVMLLHFGLFLAYFLLAVYFNEVLPDSNGVRKNPLYFLKPSYWNPKAKTGSNGDVMIRTKQDNNPVPITTDPDVAAEAAVLKQRLGEGGLVTPTDASIQVFGMQRHFNKKGFWAICDSWFEIRPRQLFCLLGPNGAGKSTTINVLTGVLPPTGGDAVVGGHSLTSPGGMDQIRKTMGVCPQFDTLWSELTGVEHMRLYGNIKGLRNAAAVEAQSSSLLQEVNLEYAATTRTGSYSGGMRRRLSVAVALLGNPQVVYLDEPTTGMDPISRRQVWNIIERAKQGRAVVLTTHSMEEADILGDRIAIMAAGTLRCLGTSMRLKQKFGAGYQISISVMSATNSDPQALSARAARVKDYMKRLADLDPSDETKAYIVYLVDRAKAQQLPQILKHLESEKSALGITDIQLALTSLDEVFLNIAHQAEEEAKARGSTRA